VFDEIPRSEKVLKRHKNSDDPCIMAWDHYRRLKDQLNRKNHLIKTLEAKLAIAEAAAKDQANTCLEQARVVDQKENERLKVDLKQTQMMAQTSQIHVGQQGELIERLQAKLDFTERQEMDIKIFQSQAIEIRKRLSIGQQGLLAKVEMIQNNCQLIDLVLEKLTLREKDARVAQVSFQEAIIAMTRRETGSSSRFSISEQTQGNIFLKANNKLER